MSYNDIGFCAIKQQNIMADLSYSNYVPKYHGLPIEESVLLADKLEKSYKQNVADKSKLDIMAANIDVLPEDQQYKDAAIQKIKDDFASIAKSGRYEDAGVLINSMSKDFITNQALNASVASNKAYQAYVTGEQERYNKGEIDYDLMNQNITAARKRYSGVQQDPDTGRYIGKFAGINTVTTPDTQEYMLQFIKELEANKSPYRFEVGTEIDPVTGEEKPIYDTIKANEFGQLVTGSGEAVSPKRLQQLLNTIMRPEDVNYMRQRSERLLDRVTNYGEIPITLDTINTLFDTNQVNKEGKTQADIVLDKLREKGIDPEQLTEEQLKSYFQDVLTTDMKNELVSGLSGAYAYNKTNFDYAENWLLKYNLDLQKDLEDVFVGKESSVIIPTNEYDIKAIDENLKSLSSQISILQNKENRTAQESQLLEQLMIQESTSKALQQSLTKGFENSESYTRLKDSVNSILSKADKHQSGVFSFYYKFLKSAGLSKDEISNLLLTNSDNSTLRNKVITASNQSLSPYEIIDNDYLSLMKDKQISVGETIDYMKNIKLGLPYFSNSINETKSEYVRESGPKSLGTNKYTVGEKKFNTFLGNFVTSGGTFNVMNDEGVLVPYLEFSNNKKLNTADYDISYSLNEDPLYGLPSITIKGNAKTDKSTSFETIAFTQDFGVMRQIGRNLLETKHPEARDIGMKWLSYGNYYPSFRPVLEAVENGSIKELGQYMGYEGGMEIYKFDINFGNTKSPLIMATDPNGATKYQILINNKEIEANSLKDLMVEITKSNLNK